MRHLSAIIGEREERKIVLGDLVLETPADQSNRGNSRLGRKIYYLLGRNGKMAINHGQILRFTKSCAEVIALGTLLVVAAAPIAHAQGG
jgi:hypothetical protein